jgi:hypothetical protein
LQDAETEATAKLNTAVNKTSVSDETRAALDALLEGKFN